MTYRLSRGEQDKGKERVTFGKKTSDEILEHNRKRMIHVKCLELKDKLEQEGLVDAKNRMMLFIDLFRVGASEIERRVCELSEQLSESSKWDRYTMTHSHLLLLLLFC